MSQKNSQKNNSSYRKRKRNLYPLARMSHRNRMNHDSSDDKGLELKISIGALLLSVISILASLFVSIRANYVAQEANRIAEDAKTYSLQANEIALGRYRAYPRIDITYNDFPDAIKLLSLNDLDELQLEVEVINDGSVFIDQIAVEIIGVPGLLQSVEPKITDYEFGVWSHRVVVDLSEQLAPGGAVVINLKSPILKYLFSAIDQNTQNDTVYRGTLNLVFSPRGIGDSLPIQSPDNLASDRFLITFMFSQQVLFADSIKEYLNEDVNIRIYPGIAPTAIP